MFCVSDIDPNQIEEEIIILWEKWFENMEEIIIRP
jgi:hypothetical protein